ncbi:MarR family winged helix-turn-helix transcriptional regulator [Halarcobacter anaerophilus]|jgi:DNA-binding MarR family transcriptional regulator|uniref:MarR family transcriptional regulator n=1 Tax=Halarcobacter anaerophilus TaxID=877500 RepID=A0A4Q0XUS3_9BACT|nr:MarR family transcriptional regulator [Halarcobacter anaerophilus]QDF28463.1 transcriptional regulator, MarR family [Halarcobacter anaerophilus]RXJ61310.1 MarR family transcriptional regulator [Halarcobacter anaerophilus]
MSFEFDNVFGVLIANIRNSLKNNIEKLLVDYDISSAQSIILRRLCEKDNLTQKELAEDTYFKPSSLTLMIDKLEKKGFVKRKAKKDDRRAFLVCLTQKGRDLEKLLIEANKKMEEEALKDIEDKELLIQTLKKIYSNIK